MNQITAARAWCDECFANCYHAYNHNTGQKTHIGPTTADLGAYAEKLTTKGYRAAHKGGGTFTYTLYKSAPLALPLDWQMAIDEQHQTKEPEYIQDW